jgi:phospholipase C
VSDAPGSQIEHVFVLMLENHSFDNLLAFSGIAGITHADPSDANAYECVEYAVGEPGAPVAMGTDPGHECADVVEQLCGHADALVPWHAYPKAIDSSGFVSNYATTESEFTKGNHRLPTRSEYRNVMACFDTRAQLPVLHALATSFAVCDQWFSSVPGPTWPNRFFAHGGSSGGWADSPSLDVIKGWIQSGKKFTYPSGASILDRLAAAGRQWRVYSDTDGDQMGGVPLIAALEGVAYPADCHPVSSLATDLEGGYPFAYTFIEPNYGDVVSGTYQGGSSQHPTDGVARGETLIKSVYEAIRNSPCWERSLLIVLYDEHGGFYDSVAPVHAPTPDDGSPQDPTINQCGFLFDHYGVRVPAIVVSPWLDPTVDHARYDHASIPATLEHRFGLAPLTARDASATTVLGLCTRSTPRTDCPRVLPEPVPGRPMPPRDPGLDAAALPTRGIAHGILAIVAHADAAAGEHASARVGDVVSALQTRGEARAYGASAVARLTGS